MTRLPEALGAWGKPHFATTLAAELERLGADRLPLQQGLSQGNYALDIPPHVMFIHATATQQAIHARVGVFYSGILTGCSCADDPTPVEPQNEYCEVCVEIDMRTGDATFSLVADSESEF